MKAAVLKETQAGERRVAATPDSVAKLKKLGLAVAVEPGAGLLSSIADSAYEAAGATLSPNPAFALTDASMLLCVQPPPLELLDLLPDGAAVIGMLSPYYNRALIEHCAKAGLSAFAMELMPRISRAQSMDVLSSQSNLAGYRAVIEAMRATAKAAPMMMTAAGTVAPAKVLVLGAGVAGLQAIATARRLGAMVTASDVRPAVKEQVESLGAKFLEVAADESAETAGGYAKEMSQDYQRRQAELLLETVKKQDIVITTALIPGRPAPVLITAEMVAIMKPGSVIVDMAASTGGNCALSQMDKAVNTHGITILGPSNLASDCASDASPLYARNLYNFVATLVNSEGRLAFSLEDELVKGTLLTHQGVIKQSFNHNA